MSAVNRIEPTMWAQPVKEIFPANSLQSMAIPMSKSKSGKSVVRRRKRNHKIITESALQNRPQHEELFDHLIEVCSFQYLSYINKRILG